MHGLAVSEADVDALGDGKRPYVTITVNGHTWASRVAILRGRYLLGFSNANRRAAGVVTGDVVDIVLTLDTSPRVVVTPPDLDRALTGDPLARAAYQRLTYSKQRALVLAIEKAKKPETRRVRIAAALAALHEGV